MEKKAKLVHRALFLALQADAKEFPGGIGGLAGMIGKSASALANGLNPDHESSPPSFSTVLEIVVLTQSKRAIYLLAQLVGQVPIDMQFEEKTPEEAVRLFLSLIKSASELFGAGSGFALDGKFDAKERKALMPMLLSLMTATGELMNAIKR